MEEKKRIVAVLFVEAFGHTPFFERTPTGAIDIISQCLDNVSEVAESFGGELIREKGDDLLCAFSGAREALFAGLQMLEMERAPDIDIQLGIHFGEVIFARGSIFGDVVNVAARMRSLAKPGEIIATEAFVQALPREERDRMRLLDQQTVRGKSELMNIYGLFRDDGEGTTRVGDRESLVSQGKVERPKVSRVEVALSLGGEIVARGKEGTTTTLGRADKCDIVFIESCVSREHASVIVRRGKVLIADVSSTGTWIEPADGERVLLRREMTQIEGEGLISLGIRPEKGGPTLIRYAISADEPKGLE